MKEESMKETQLDPTISLTVTLRDYFAAAALPQAIQSILYAMQMDGMKPDAALLSEFYADVAKMSYEMADKLLEARKR
jgi:hypothetical protein